MSDPSFEVDTTLSAELRDWLMATLRFPVLAVLDNRGRPSQSVMWFDLDRERADTIILNTMTRRAKFRWLQRDPRVSLCFQDRYDWVSVQGVIEIDDDPERGLATIRHLAERYDADPEQFDGEPRATLRLRIARVIRY